jgi:dGTPase
MEELEKQTLAPFAMRSFAAHASRRHTEEEHGYRTAFQRDRDRIIHSRAFRRLKHKRQVFLTSGSDHHRTRITHTMEVSQLSRTMARTLGLNEDLVEAIALGHDLGHTPFGHLGEVVLDDIMSGKIVLQGVSASDDFGGFKHNYQSLRILDRLEKKYSFAGLNLTATVREGILKHTRIRRGRFSFPDFDYDGLNFDQDMCSTLEGQAVAMGDEIAQRTHDLEDGIRAGLVDWQKVRKIKIIGLMEKKLALQSYLDFDTGIYQGLLIRGLINLLVDDVIHQTLQNLRKFYERKNRLCSFDEELIRFSPGIDPLQKELNRFIYKEIIDHSREQWSDDLGKKLICRLFETYLHDPELLPDYIIARYEESDSGSAIKLDIKNLQAVQADAVYYRIVCDYIAGMTDQYAVREVERLAKLGRMASDDLELSVVLGNT